MVHQNLGTQLSTVINTTIANYVMFSHKAKRPSIYVLGNETMAFADVFDKTLSIKMNIEVFNRPLLLLMLTDTLSLFFAITTQLIRLRND